MTENEIRKKVVETAKAWLGVRAGSAEHENILKIYNSQSPLPRGTRMREEWPWCAVFVSAVVLKCDLRDIMPTEMSCPKMRALYEQIGRWIEADDYVPLIGDLIMYDWDDRKDNYATTDNTGDPDHVGIVIACDSKTIFVIEGNNERNEVGVRPIEVNGRFIRGFCAPDYASKATETEPAVEPDAVNDLARRIATEINDSGLDAAAVLSKVSALLGIEKGTETPTEPEQKTPTAAEIDALARAVIAGQYGNGAARRALLGDNYDAVQKRVNEILRG